jgi:prevent-host-death family protein
VNSLTYVTPVRYDERTGKEYVMTNVYSPTAARQNFFQILKQVNDEHEPVIVNNERQPQNAGVIMGQADYEALLETVALIDNGQLPDALIRQKDSAEFVDAEDIDWDKL